MSVFTLDKCICLYYAWHLHIYRFKDLKIVLIVRDPRAVMNARSQVKWCQESTYCKAHCPKLHMIEENRASDNKCKLHSFLMCRIWIYSQKLISSLDIRVRVHLTHFWKIWLFSSTSALATTSCCKLTEPCWQWCWQLLEYQDFQKQPKFSKNVLNAP